MFKKIGCLLPILAVLLFLTYISIKQGYNTIYNEDWAENFSTQKVLVVNIAIDSSYTSDGGGFSSWHYSFNPIVERDTDGKIESDTVLFMTSYEESDWYPGDSIFINVNNFDGNLSKDIDTDRNGTGIVNIIMGLVFFVLSIRIVQFLIKAKQKKEEAKEQN